MEDYQHYTVEDFVLDPEFKTWVKNPATESNLFWQQWQHAHPDKKEIVQQAITIIQHFPIEDVQRLSSADRLHLIHAIEAGMDSLADKTDSNKEEGTVVPLKLIIPNPAQPVRMALPKWTWSVAAAVLLTIVTTYYFFNSQEVRQNEHTAALVHEQNPNGKKSVVLLKDGSRVTLNADSKITYPASFGPSNRQVYLEGEAFFEVTKDASRPFQVITGEIKTVALGTSFNIRAYPDDGNIEVSLATGKVKIQHDKTLAVLETLVPGEQIIYQKESGTIQKEEIPQDEISPWKTGVIQFDHARQQEVFKTLERWYGVHFEMENSSPLPVDVNGKFEDESIENVLEVLRYSMKFRYKKDQDKITISYEN